jgi:plasmid segregation protein ParM
LIDKQARSFVDDMLGKLRERMVDLRSGKTVFTGGGSILLQKYIEDSDKVNKPIFLNDVAANVKGYELLYQAYREAK